MKTLKERIQWAYNGGRVVRFHQHIGHRLDTDASHSHGVALLTLFLSEGLPSNHLLLAALSHDLAEQCVGDVPFPTKRSVPGLREQLESIERALLREYELEFSLSAEELHVLGLADALDGMLYCASEAALGNRTLHEVYTKWKSVVTGLNCTDVQADTINAVIEIYEESYNDKARDNTKA